MIERKRPSAVVLGSVHMDLIATAAHLPGRGESVAGGTFAMSPGGKGGNQACQLALCGCSTRILTRLGDDLFGRQLIAALAAKGVDTSLIAIDNNAPTGASTVFAAEGDYCSIIASGAAGDLGEDGVERQRQAIATADALVLQLELPPRISAYAARIAHKAGKHVVLNASPAPQGLADLPSALRDAVTILVVNRVEAARLLGCTPIDALDAAVQLARQLGVETVVVTAGAEGSAAVSRGVQTFQPAYAADLVDTVGAGDAFLGTFVAGMLDNQSLEQALRRGAAAGALAVSKRGAHDALPSRAEIDRFLKKPNPTAS